MQRPPRPAVLVSPLLENILAAIGGAVVASLIDQVSDAWRNRRREVARRQQAILDRMDSLEQATKLLEAERERGRRDRPPQRGR